MKARTRAHNQVRREGEPLRPTQQSSTTTALSRRKVRRRITVEMDGGIRRIGGFMAATRDGQVAPTDRSQLTRAVIASTIGTSIEWYDFFLYSTVTGLVFAKLYFPNSDPLVGTLQAFGIYAVGLIAPATCGPCFRHCGAARWPR